MKRYSNKANNKDEYMWKFEIEIAVSNRGSGNPNPGASSAVKVAALSKVLPELPLADDEGFLSIQLSLASFYHQQLQHQ